jgi:DNA invertase Pin-like site-specific DNA recombinase
VRLAPGESILETLDRRPFTKGMHQRKVNLVSLKDGLDLSTPAGRLMANVLANVAVYET